MKKIIFTLLFTLSSITFGATLTPIQLLNPAGSASGQVITSSGASTSPMWTSIPVTSVAGRTGAITLAVGDVTNAAGLISPSFTTPSLGAATATSINGNFFTTGTGTLTFAATKTLTVSNSLTFAGTDGVTYTGPTTSASLARTDAAQTFLSTQTFSIAQYASGSATAPTISFSSLPNAGFYSPGTDSIGMTLAGVVQYRAVTNAIRFRSSYVLGWASGAADSTNLDTAFSRTAAGVLALGNGTGSDATGILKLASISHAKQDIDLSYTYNQPTTGTTVTLATGTQTAIIDPAGTLAALTVTLPACNAAYDGSISRFSSSQAVTVLTVNATSGTVVGGPTSLALGSGSGYICRGSSTTWYRLY